MKIFVLTALALIIFPAAALAAAEAPDVTLPDPDGGMHNVASLLKGGGVLVMTAPTLPEKGVQEGWSKCLPDAMPKGGMLIFIEDMSVSAWKSIAENDMRKDWKPGVPPMLLLDEKGGVRNVLGEARDATGVFVYGKGGGLVYTYRGGPSAGAAKTIWGKVK
ncbi:MAG: hypothetical protein WC683_08470 [bacterium]